MKIDYKRLPFGQYFVDTSDNWANCGTPRYEIKYIAHEYTYKNKTFEANYEIHYEPDRNVIQINFQQTNGKLDWLTNFLFTSKYYDTFTTEDNEKITLRVHNGWAAMYKSIKHQIREAILKLTTEYPDAEIEIIGWSLGSGQACLCAQDLEYNFGIKSYLYTYGSVNLYKTNIFNRKKIMKYLNSCCKAIYNFADINDIVGYVVPRCFGFVKPNRVTVKQKRFCILRLLNPNKYHTEYYKKELYDKIQ